MSRPGPQPGCELRSAMNVLPGLCGLVLLCSLAGCGSHSRAPVEDRYGSGESAVRVYNVQRGDTLYSIAFRYGLDYRKVAEVNRIAEPYTIYPGQNIYLWQVTPSPVIVDQAPAAPVVSSAPGSAVAPPSDPSPVIVTAVPGIAAAPVSQVTMPPSPVYRNGRPVEPVTPAVTAPAIATPPVAGAAPANAAGPTPAPAPAAAPVVTPAPAPARPPTPGGKVTAWRWPTDGTVSRRYSPSVHKGIDISGSRGDPVYAVADGTVVYAGTGIVGFGELIIIKHNDIYISAYGHNSRLLVRENEVVRAGQTIAEKGNSGTDTVKLHFEIRREGKPVDPLQLLPRR